MYKRQVLSCGSEKEASLIADEEGNTRQAKEVQVTFGTIGKVIDAGIKDANQMGAAMAPAAVDTLLNHLQDTGRSLRDYDLILTGDLEMCIRDREHRFHTRRLSRSVV